MSDTAKVTDGLGCPFCGDAGFDLVGLKVHLLRWCTIFSAMESPEEEQKRLGREKAAFPSAREKMK